MKTIVALVLALSAHVRCLAAEPPITQSEAAKVFAKAERVLGIALRLKVAPPAFPGGSATATREQILQRFTTLYTVILPKVKFNAPPLKSAPNVISFKNPQVKQMALRLEVLGFIDRYGPLATSKDEGLPPDEFGDAIGYFLARVAELTHTPASKFSPYLSAD